MAGTPWTPFVRWPGDQARQTRLELVDLERFDDGAVLLGYRVGR